MKKSNIWGNFVLMFSLMFALSFLVSAKAEAQKFKPEIKSIKLGLPVTTSTFTPIYLAVQEGLYEKEGLSVELITFRGGSDLIKGMVGDSVDLGLTSFAGVSLGIRAGQKMKVFYAGFNMSIFDWYSTPKYNSLDNIKGAKFGVSRIGSSTDFLTRFVLLARGVDPDKDVKIIQGGGSASRLAAQEAGQLDVNIFAPPEKFMAADMGYNLLIRQRDAMNDYPFHVFFAKEDFIAKNPNTIKAFLRGSIRGIRLTKQNKAIAEKIIVDKIRIDPKYAARTLDDWIDGVYEDGRMCSEEGMDTFFKIGIMSGSFKEKWPEEKYLDRTYIDSYNDWKP